MQVSEHFTLSELTFSEAAARHGLKNDPGVDEIAALVRLCEFVLEPLRADLGKAIHVTSAYRSPDVNRAVGGAASSEHVLGRAADIHVDGMTPLEVCKAIVRLNLPYNQVIHEFGAWCHVSVCAASAVPKRQTLTATKSGGKTVYSAGLFEVKK